MPLNCYLARGNLTAHNNPRAACLGGRPSSALVSARLRRPQRPWRRAPGCQAAARSRPGPGTVLRAADALRRCLLRRTALLSCLQAALLCHFPSQRLLPEPTGSSSTPVHGWCSTSDSKQCEATTLSTQQLGFKLAISSACMPFGCHLPGSRSQLWRGPQALPASHSPSTARRRWPQAAAAACSSGTAAAPGGTPQRTHSTRGCSAQHQHIISTAAGRAAFWIFSPIQLSCAQLV